MKYIKLTHIKKTIRKSSCSAKETKFGHPHQSLSKRREFCTQMISSLLVLLVRASHEQMSASEGLSSYSIRWANKWLNDLIKYSINLILLFFFSFYTKDSFDYNLALFLDLPAKRQWLIIDILSILVSTTRISYCKTINWHSHILHYTHEFV